MVNENKYDILFQKYAGNNKLDWMLLKAQVKAESNFDVNAISPVGAVGLAQFMPQTWKEFGEGHPYDAEQSIKAQAKYMRWLFDYLIKLLYHKKDLIDWALASYNWGIGNVRKLALDVNGNFEESYKKLPIETQKYVKRIRKYYYDYNHAEFLQQKKR
ncbi:MAG TPA: transglycosylase SLT domain-containing protein [Bacteroidales bacterium]|nr:transglycosylase SLT domain-containing protein [Bacteroidales bacterium]